MSLTNPLPSEIIAACAAGLEDANEHSIDVTDIWTSVLRYIPSKDRKAAARTLADSLCDRWESYLPNVTE